MRAPTIGDHVTVDLAAGSVHGVVVVVRCDAVVLDDGHRRHWVELAAVELAGGFRRIRRYHVFNLRADLRQQVLDRVAHRYDDDAAP